jgi:hypothetical protein
VVRSSTKRYFPQDMATDYIGFRCAMSRTKAEQKDHQEIKLLYIIKIKALD